MAFDFSKLNPLPKEQRLAGVDEIIWPHRIAIS
jgi:hypothetical protein